MRPENFGACERLQGLPYCIRPIHCLAVLSGGSVFFVLQAFRSLSSAKIFWSHSTGKKNLKAAKIFWPHFTGKKRKTSEPVRAPRAFTVLSECFGDFEAEHVAVGVCAVCAMNADIVVESIASSEAATLSES